MDKTEAGTDAIVPVDAAEPDGTRGTSVIGPSTNPATNLLIADVVLRGASNLFRTQVERGMVKKSDDADIAREIIDGRGIVKTLALYGVSKLATRSTPGLVIVAGGLLVKTLYDRGKSLERRKKSKRKK